MEQMKQMFLMVLMVAVSNTATADYPSSCFTKMGNDRILLMNNDNNAQCPITLQSYYDTNTTDLTYWTDDGDPAPLEYYYVSGEDMSRFNLKYGTHHILWERVEAYTNLGGETMVTSNKLWELVDCRAGSAVVSRSTSSSGRNYIPWTTTSLNIDTGNVMPSTAYDGAGMVIMQNTTNSCIISPFYTNGVGAIYFDAINGWCNRTGELVLEIATETVDGTYFSECSTNLNWQIQKVDVLEVAISPRAPTVTMRDTDVETIILNQTQTTSSYTMGRRFFRIRADVSYCGPIRFRIRRTTKADYIWAVDSPTYMLVDNIMASYAPLGIELQHKGKGFDASREKERVLGWEGAVRQTFAFTGEQGVQPWAAFTGTTSCSGVQPVVGAFKLSDVQFHYRWTKLGVENGTWQTFPMKQSGAESELLVPADDMASLPFTNGVCDIEYYYTAKIDDYTANGNEIPHFWPTDFALGTRVTNLVTGTTYKAPYGSDWEEVGWPRTIMLRRDAAEGILPSGGTDWFFRVREGYTEHEDMAVIMRDSSNGVVSNVWMELVGTNVWRTNVYLPQDTAEKMMFSFCGYNRQHLDTDGFDYNTNEWRFAVSAIQSMPYSGTADGSQLATLALDDKFSSFLFEFNDMTGDFSICCDPKFIIDNGTLTAVELIHATSVEIPDGVTAIGEGVFSNCTELTNITIPPSVTNIGERAFYQCIGLTDILIPDGVTAIASSAFSGCRGLMSATINQSACDKRMSVLFPETYWTMTNIVISVGVTNVGDYAFVSCSGLTSVTIPDSVISIWNSAFLSCRGLTNVIIPNSVTSIGNYAFFNCSSLTNVTIPNSVTNIGAGVFSGCSGLKEISLPFVGARRGITGTPEALFGYIFGTWSYVGGTSTKQYYNSSSYVYYYIPASLRHVSITDETQLGYGVFLSCSGLDNVTLPECMTYIGERAFYKCSGLTEMVIPDSVTTIGTNSFYGCSGLLNLDIGEGVVDICNAAFRYCGGLTNVVIAGNVERIETSAFGSCSNLTEVTISDNVTFIGASAFRYCNKLDRVAIGAGIGSLGSYAFSDCPVLRTVEFVGNSPSKFGSDVFSGTASGCCAYVHFNSTGWGASIPGTWKGIAIDYVLHDVIFETNGGTCETTMVRIREGSGIGKLPVPTRKNAAFLGWHTATDGGTLIDASTIVTSDMVLYAQWRTVSLEEALNIESGVLLETSEVAPWALVSDSTAKVGEVSARSGAIGDRTNTWLTATVEGSGTMTFWCKVSCEHDEDNTFGWDRLMIYTNGVEIVEWRMDGETDWTERTVTFSGGSNTVKWLYYKDRTGTEGEDCAWVDGVTWTPSGVTSSDPIPSVALDAEPLAVTNAIEAAGFADMAAIKTAIGGEGAATKYAAFKKWAGSVKGAIGSASAASAAGEAAVIANTNAAVAFLLGAERLFENVPVIEFGEVAMGTDDGGLGTSRPTMAVSVIVKDGEDAVQCAAEKVKEMFEATGDLSDWAANGGSQEKSQLPVTVNVVEESGSQSAAMRFNVTPGDGTASKAFLRVKMK